MEKKRISLDTLLLDPDFIENVVSWIKTAHEGVLLIHQSQVGAGVTTMLDLLEEQIQTVSFLHTLDIGSGKINVIGQRKILVLDPFDCDIVDATRMKKIQTIIDGRLAPIIIAGFHRRGTLAKLSTILKKSIVTDIRVPKIDDTRAVEYLQTLGHPDATTAWKRSGGDLRSCIESLSIGDVRERLPDGVDALRTLLSTPDRPFSDMCRVAEGDSTIMIDGMFENYIHAVDNDDLVSVSNALEIIEKCDGLQTLMYRYPNIEVHDQIAALVAGVSSTCNVNSTKPIEKYGTVWARRNHAIVKAGVQKSVSMEGLHPDTIPFIRDMLFRGGDRAVQTLQDIHPDTLWKITTLWPRGQKKALYTKKKHQQKFSPQG
jgi:hypothetical protein